MLFVKFFEDVVILENIKELLFVLYDNEWVICLFGVLLFFIWIEIWVKLIFLVFGEVGGFIWILGGILFWVGEVLNVGLLKYDLWFLFLVVLIDLFCILWWL